MRRFARILSGVMLTMLCMPMTGIASDAGAAKQLVGTQEAAGSSSWTGARSTGEAVKKSDQRDVQSRGLFSKKKKKKPVGGAAGHSQPSEQTDRAQHDGLSDSK